MYLGARILSAVADKNNFEYATEWVHRQKTQDTLYLQLVDLDHNRAGQPEGIRYVPAAGSTMTVTLGSIDAVKAVSRAATQPFPLDPSIWKVDILAADDPGEGNIEISMTEAGVVRKARVTNGVSVESDDPSMC